MLDDEKKIFMTTNYYIILNQTYQFNNYIKKLGTILR